MKYYEFMKYSITLRGERISVIIHIGRMIDRICHTARGKK